MLVALLLVLQSLSPLAGVRSASPPADTLVVDTTRATVVLDEADREHVRVTAYWAPLAAELAPRAHGGAALHDGGAADDGEVRYLLPSGTRGRYAVALYWPRLREAHGRLATNVKVFVRHDGRRTDLVVDQRDGGDAWRELGVFSFGTGAGGLGEYVEIINNSADGVVVADAVRLVPVL